MSGGMLRRRRTGAGLVGQRPGCHRRERIRRRAAQLQGLDCIPGGGQRKVQIMKCINKLVNEM